MQQLAKTAKIIKDLDSRQGLDCTVLWPRDDWDEPAPDATGAASEELAPVDVDAFEGDRKEEEDKQLRVDELAPAPGEWKELSVEEQLSYATRYLLSVHGYEFELDTED